MRLAALHDKNQQTIVIFKLIFSCCSQFYLIILKCLILSRAFRRSKYQHLLRIFYSLLEKKKDRLEHSKDANLELMLSILINMRLAALPSEIRVVNPILTLEKCKVFSLKIKTIFTLTGRSSKFDTIVFRIYQVKKEKVNTH